MIDSKNGHLLLLGKCYRGLLEQLGVFQGLFLGHHPAQFILSPGSPASDHTAGASSKPLAPTSSDGVDAQQHHGNLSHILVGQSASIAPDQALWYQAQRDPPGQAEPGDNPELSVVVNVVVGWLEQGHPTCPLLQIMHERWHE